MFVEIAGLTTTIRQAPGRETKTTLEDARILRRCGHEVNDGGRDQAQRLLAPSSACFQEGMHSRSVQARSIIASSGSPPVASVATTSGRRTYSSK